MCCAVGRNFPTGEEPSLVRFATRGCSNRSLRLTGINSFSKKRRRGVSSAGAAGGFVSRFHDRSAFPTIQNAAAGKNECRVLCLGGARIRYGLPPVARGSCSCKERGN